MTPADAAAHRALRLRMLAEHPDAFTSSHDEESLRPLEDTAKRLSGANHKCWGAWDADRLGGMIGLEREARAKNRHKATVVGMYVVPELAGRGVGRLLLDEVTAQARRDGIELLVLTVTHGNERAATLYERAGFRSFGIEPRAIKVGGRYFDKNHMVLDLATSQPS